MMCRPRLWVFLWTGGWFSGVPSTFLVVFVDGRVVLWCAVHVLGVFVAGRVVLSCAVHV